jgi:hypothetical protein
MDRRRFLQTAGRAALGRAQLRTIPFSEAIGTQSQVAQLAQTGAPRLLLHNVIAPNFDDLGARLTDMATQAATGCVTGYNVYTAWGPNGQGFSLEDPRIGLPVIQQAHDDGVKVFTAHKGLPLMRFDAAHSGPDDIVAVSRQFPDMDFVVFHGAWDPNHREGPYDPNAALGIDTFLHALDVHQVPPNSNVWVDLGTVWRQLLSDPDQAAHAVGKLLTRVGDQRVLWGTDAVWYGSPQPQLMAFRAFAITAEYQERFGYPALTESVKRNVLGLNAAQLFHVDSRPPPAARWRPTRSLPPKPRRPSFAPMGHSPPPGNLEDPPPGASCCAGSAPPRPAGRRRETLRRFGPYRFSDESRGSRVPTVATPRHAGA